MLKPDKPVLHRFRQGLAGRQTEEDFYEKSNKACQLAACGQHDDGSVPRFCVRSSYGGTFPDTVTVQELEQENGGSITVNDLTISSGVPTKASGNGWAYDGSTLTFTDAVYDTRYSSITITCPVVLNNSTVNGEYLVFESTVTITGDSASTLNAYKYKEVVNNSSAGFCLQAGMVESLKNNNNPLQQTGGVFKEVQDAPTLHKISLYTESYYRYTHFGINDYNVAEDHTSYNSPNGEYHGYVAAGMTVTASCDYSNMAYASSDADDFTYTTSTSSYRQTICFNMPEADVKTYAVDQLPSLSVGYGGDVDYSSAFQVPGKNIYTGAGWLYDKDTNTVTFNSGSYSVSNSIQNYYGGIALGAKAIINGGTFDGFHFAKDVVINAGVADDAIKNAVFMGAVTDNRANKLVTRNLTIQAESGFVFLGQNFKNDNTAHTAAVAGSPTGLYVSGCNEYNYRAFPYAYNWSAEGISLTEKESYDSYGVKFNMPATGDVSIKGVFKHGVLVHDGTAYRDEAHTQVLGTFEPISLDSTVYLKYTEDPDRRFVKWTGFAEESLYRDDFPIDSFGDAASKETYFVLKDSHWYNGASTNWTAPWAEITAETVPLYAISITGGEAYDNEACEGDPITKAAKDDTVYIKFTGGDSFSEWTTTANRLSFTDKTQSVTSFKMLSQAVAIQAIADYALTIEGGAAYSDAACSTLIGERVQAGTTVYLKADPEDTGSDDTGTEAALLAAETEDDDTDDTPAFQWYVHKPSSLTITGSTQREGASFVMPYSDVVISTAAPVVPGGDPIVTAPAADTGGAAIVAGAALGAAAYLVGTDLWLNATYGSIPANRQQLALALWNQAGRPAAQSTALYADIAAADTDMQTAAHWCAEHGLMKDFGESFKPSGHVFRPQALTAWYKLAGRQ